jgi:hypothetical protein
VTFFRAKIKEPGHRLGVAPDTQVSLAKLGAGGRTDFVLPESGARRRIELVELAQPPANPVPS